MTYKTDIIEWSSDLTPEECTRRLRRQTRGDNTGLRIVLPGAETIFAGKQPLFCGEVNQSGFRITKNSIRFGIPYVFEGNILSSKSGCSDITLTIRPMYIRLLWVTIMPVVMVALINIPFFVPGEDYDTASKIIRGIFSVMLLFLPYYNLRRMRRKFLGSLYKVLEVSGFA